MLKYRLKNYIILLMAFFISTGTFAQKKRSLLGHKKTKIEASTSKAGKFIDVNVPPYAPSSFTAEQLVKNVLISGGSACIASNVTNVTVSPNHSETNNDRFWGYLIKRPPIFLLRMG
ncbi:hypothetical protein ACFOEQ_25365 [Chryseobacterium arachidis]|uniref:hypothetical protein n=1 Tax=Chryseobacterium arachidis TaxID=1416778 RepID=UPI00360D0BB8